MLSMDRISRRKFIQKSALATAGTMLIPQFLKALEKPFAEGDKILIVLQLSGGNDGLNTIIPLEMISISSRGPRLQSSLKRFCTYRMNLVSMLHSKNFTAFMTRAT